jgi:hypothetical protein
MAIIILKAIEHMLRTAAAICLTGFVFACTPIVREKSKSSYHLAFKYGGHEYNSTSGEFRTTPRFGSSSTTLFLTDQELSNLCAYAGKHDFWLFPDTILLKGIGMDPHPNDQFLEITSSEQSKHVGWYGHAQEIGIEGQKLVMIMDSIFKVLKQYPEYYEVRMVSPY